MARRGEDALGKVAEDLVENSLVSGAVQLALDARERASQVQDVAMEALNFPSATDLQRLTRRVRSVSQRLEGVEDGIDRLEERLASLAARLAGGQADDNLAEVLEQRLAQIESRLDDLARDLSVLKNIAQDVPEPVPRSQERLAVRDSG